ncbi:MAG: hypothetical protein M3Z15_10860 [Pseudomonadota bacterium]|nr:hypothetical protein [Pseudomonadota bacterium]
MSCYISALQGGDPRREIFPLQVDRMEELRALGGKVMLAMLGIKGIKQLSFNATQHVGAALKPDGTPFYLTTIAPDFGEAADPVGAWRGAFFAPFGIGDIVGTVEGVLAKPGARPTAIVVKARLILDAGGKDMAAASDRKVRVSVDWEVHGNQATRPNKAALIDSVTIHDAGPHDPADLRRCVALHAPQRGSGEARAIIAMQCGVAAACLLEAIC